METSNINKELIDDLEQTASAESADQPAVNVAPQLLRCLRQVDALMIIHQLHPLIIAVQQHRGASLALAGGNSDFQGKQQTLQTEIEQRIAALELINNAYHRPLSENKMAKLKNEWSALVHNCQYGHVMENFELHCFFVEQLMELIWALTIKAEYFSVHAAHQQVFAESGLASSEQKESRLDNRLLIQVLLRDFPQLIEVVARIRGIATHTTVTRHCDADYRKRLLFWVQTAHRRKEALQMVIGRLNHKVLSDMPALLEMQLQEHRLVQLLNMTKEDIIGQEVVEIESQRIFDFATGIIDVYSKVIQQGMLFIRSTIDEELTSLPAKIR